MPRFPPLSDRTRRVFYRLAYLVPLTVWPFLVVFGDPTLIWTGHGSRNALAFVATELGMLSFATSVIGLLLIVWARICWEDVALYVFVAALHHIAFMEILTGRIVSHSVK